MTVTLISPARGEPLVTRELFGDLRFITWCEEITRIATGASIVITERDEIDSGAAWASEFYKNIKKIFALIAQMQAQIAALQADVATLEADVAALQTALAAAVARINDLEIQVLLGSVALAL